MDASKLLDGGEYSMSASWKLEIGGSLYSTMEMRGFSYSSHIFPEERNSALVVSMVDTK